MVLTEPVRDDWSGRREAGERECGGSQRLGGLSGIRSRLCRGVLGRRGGWEGRGR